MSLRALLLDGVLRRVIKHHDSGGGTVAVEMDRRRSEGVPQPAPVPGAVVRRLHVSKTTVGSRPVVHMRSRPERSRRAVVFLPGGGYVNPVSTAHWNALARLVRAASVDAVVPLYQVAPAGNAAAAHEVVREVLDETLREYGAGNVHVMGDSAGAGLALSVVQRDPSGVRSLVLLSPWADVEMTNSAADAVAEWDVILRAEELRGWGRAWADGIPTSDPRVSPLRGPLDGLPPVLVATGGRDVLMPDALELHRRIDGAGGDSTLLYAPDANHAVGLTGAASPEGRRVFGAVVDALRR